MTVIDLYLITREIVKFFSKNGSFCWVLGEFLFSLLMRFVLFIVIIIIIEHFVSVPVSWRDAGCT